MSNALRSVLKMDRNVTRSSNGVRVSTACCNTRPLNASQLNSRLMNSELCVATSCIEGRSRKGATEGIALGRVCCHGLVTDTRLQPPNTDDSTGQVAISAQPYSILDMRSPP